MSAARSTDERSRKLLIRSILVGGTTVATLIGAQSLTWIDAARFALTSVPETMTLPTEASANTASVIQQAAPTLSIQYSAPSLVVLRRPGVAQSSQAQSAAPAVSAGGVIQPPMPVVNQPETIIVDQPVVVQQPVYVQQAAPAAFSAPAPVVASSRSSR